MPNSLPCATVISLRIVPDGAVANVDDSCGSDSIAAAITRLSVAAMGDAATAILCGDCGPASDRFKRISLRGPIPIMQIGLDQLDDPHDVSAVLTA